MTQHLSAIADWVGDAPPTPPLGADGEAYLGCFFLQTVTALRTKHDKAYLKLTLAQRSGTVDARVWDDAERVQERLAAVRFVGVRGRVSVFNGSTQLVVEGIQPIRVEAHELELFVPRSRRDPQAMEDELAGLVSGFEDTALRTLVEALLDPTTETGKLYRVAPAAKQNHHAYLCGLLEHSVSVATVCDALGLHYSDAVDRDLLLAGALLHDIGKTREISCEAGFPYTDEGKLLGHILIGLDMVRDAARAVPALTPDRLRLLLHLVASHQGRYEWQSPREPRTLEALILHYADDLDAKLNQVGALVDAVEDEGWSAYDRGLQREFLRHRFPERQAVVDAPASDRMWESAGPPASEVESARSPEIVSQIEKKARSKRSAPAAVAEPAADADPLDNDTLDLFGG